MIYSHNVAVIDKKKYPMMSKFIDKHLVINTKDYNTEEVTTHYYYEENDSYWITPRWFPEFVRKTYGLYDHIQIEYLKNDIQEIDFDCNIEPKNEKQAKAIAFLSKPNQRFGILKAFPGFGKTICTIKAIHNLKHRSLILVPNNIALAKQWKDKILQFTNIPEDKIPIFSGKFNKDMLNNMYIGIAVVNTLSNRYLSKNKDIYDIMRNARIGSIFIDECHVTIPTPYFHKAQFLLYGNRFYGISATPFRNNPDITNIIYHNVSDNIFNASDYSIKPVVYEVYFSSNIPQKTKKWITWGNKFSIQRYLKKVIEIPYYRQILCNMIMKAYSSGRKVVIMSPRKELLHIIKDELIMNHNVDENDIGIYVSGSSKDELKKQIIFTTTQIFYMGLDQPDIDTLIIVDNIGNQAFIEQSIGRAIREYSGKKTPKIVFLVDVDFDLFKFVSSKRQRIYEKLGFEYHIIDLISQ